MMLFDVGDEAFWKAGYDPMLLDEPPLKYVIRWGRVVSVGASFLAVSTQSGCETVVAFVPANMARGTPQEADVTEMPTPDIGCPACGNLTPLVDVGTGLVCRQCRYVKLPRR